MTALLTEKELAKVEEKRVRYMRLSMAPISLIAQDVPRLVADLRAARAALRDYGVAAGHLDHARKNRRWVDCGDYFAMLSAADKKARDALPLEDR